MRKLAPHQRIILAGLILGAVGACYSVVLLIRLHAYGTLVSALAVGIAFNLGWYAPGWCSRDQRNQTTPPPGGGNTTVGYPAAGADRGGGMIVLRSSVARAPPT